VSFRSSLVAVAFFALMQAGCADISVMKKDAVYDPNENAVVVIVGQAFKSGCTPGVSAWSGIRDEAFPDFSFFLANTVGCLEKGGHVGYSVLKVAPSQFVLNFFDGEQSKYLRNRCRTIYTDDGISFSAPPFKERKAPKFAALKGEVVYVGDIIYEAPCNPKVIGVVRNDKAAQAALADYPNFKADMVYRPLIINNREVNAPKVE